MKGKNADNGAGAMARLRGRKKALESFSYFASTPQGAGKMRQNGGDFQPPADAISGGVYWEGRKSEKSQQDAPKTRKTRTKPARRSVVPLKLYDGAE